MSSNSLHEPVLCLRKDWTAHKFVTAFDALTMMCLDRARAVETFEGSFVPYDMAEWIALSKRYWKTEPEKHEWVKCIEFHMLVPHTIVDDSPDTMKRRRPKMSRRAIYHRDRCTCQYCGTQLRESECELEHVMPKTRGGRFSFTNIVVACRACNSRKADRTPEEAGMKLLRQPKVPVDDVEIDLPFKSTRSFKAGWAAFLDAAYWDIELTGD